MANKFEAWSTKDLAAQCRAQAIDGLDINFSNFMKAVEHRLQLLVKTEWRPISEADPEKGAKMVLAWDVTPTSPFQWETGWYNRNKGWVNMYSHRFGAPDPTHFMVPLEPSKCL